MKRLCYLLFALHYVLQVQVCSLCIELLLHPFPGELTHHLVACGVGVQPVLLPVGSQLCRRFWVAHDFVEVQHSVEFSALANPFVHALAGSLVEIRPVEAAAKGSDGASIDFESVFVCLADKCLISVYQFLCCLLHIRAAADIVHTLEDNEMRHSRLFKNIAVEALQSWLAQTTPYDSVSSDAQVQHPYPTLKGLCH